MATPGYWMGQFREAFPHFLAEWYIEHKMANLDSVCSHLGVPSLLGFTDGYYKTRAIGEWICHHTQPVEHAISFIEEHADGNGLESSFFKALNDQISYTIKNRPWHKGILESYHVVFVDTIGEAVKKTKWWKDNKKNVIQESRRMLAVKSVMEC
jgi:hypothetical protein